MRPEEMRELLTFNAWANRRILGAAGALTQEQFTQQIVSSFRSVQETLQHIAGAELAWMERVQGRSPEKMPAAPENRDLKTLESLWSPLLSLMEEYGRGLTQERLDELVDYKTFSFGDARSPRWQMLQHMVNHGTYHRGQVITMLRQLGAKSVGTDMIMFYRERAATAGA
jgi:uncharacterized damage-inducible protein DinB